jgi:ribosome maturation factor RimP
VSETATSPEPLPELSLIGAARRAVPARVRVAVAPIVEGLGLEFVGVELSRDGSRQVLWVFLDAEGGLTLDDCARAHPEISAALDVDDPIAEAYELRVSSPGLDRPLMSDRDFLRFAGREVIVQLSEPHDGRRKFTGRIGPVRDDAVELACQDGTFAVPLEKIGKARLKFDMPQGGHKPGKKP